MKIFINLIQLFDKQAEEQSETDKEEKFDFEVYIDGTFKGSSVDGYVESGYIALNKDKITNDAVEIKIICIVKKEKDIKREYIFCKEYNLETNWQETLNTDVETYIKNKRDREIKR